MVKIGALHINRWLKMLSVIVLFIYYAIGIYFFIAHSDHIQLQLSIPLSILLTFAFVVLFDQSSTRSNLLIIFLLLFFLSFCIEKIGVATGLVFGSYVYGESLGPKIFHVPIIIGANWVWLVYATAAIIYPLGVSKLMQVLCASILMVLYDFIVEPIAPRLDMWFWHGSTVPIQNYIAWFTISFLFHLLLIELKIRIKNTIASFAFLIQLMFFVILNIFLS